MNINNSIRRVTICLIGLKVACTALGSGVVTNFSESALKAALSNGGTVSFAGNGTIVLTNTLLITKDTVLDGSGNSVTISGGNAVRSVRGGDAGSTTSAHMFYKVATQ